MIKTYGLTHIALLVKNVQVTSDFYQKVFGAKEMYSSKGFIQVQCPASHDIIVFKEGESDVKKGGILHFGFRLVEMEDMDTVVKTIEEAGGVIKESGKFKSGEPYVFFHDPDGYEVEVWYEQLPASLVNFN